MKKLDGKKSLLIALSVLMLAGCSCSRIEDEPVENSNDGIWDVTIDENAGEITETDYAAIQEELNKKVAETSINISMNTNPVFNDGQSEGNLMITNEEINRFMQVIEIYRDDTNKLIYKSNAIPVGTRIENDTLDVDLPAGEYECTAYFNAIRDTGEYVGKAAAKITISVLN